MTLRTSVQEFQTLIVGIFGFAGVIFTLWFNARQARRQRRDERRHECQTMRVALIEELKINRKTLAHSADKLKGNGNNILVPTDVADDAYRRFTDRIGVLSQEEVRKVMHAYLGLQNYNSKLFLIGVARPTDDRYVLVGAENVRLLSGMQEAGIEPIGEAIEALEQAREAG